MSIPHHSTNTSSLVSMLTAGMRRTQAAQSLNITPSAVTQLANTPEVAAELEAARARSSQLDARYDSIEGKLLDQLERVLPMLTRAGEIANVLTRVNQAKRRGVAADTPNTPSTVIQLNLPTSVQNRFVVNSSNQVVTAGEQDLVTIPSQAVTKLLESHHEPKIPLIEQEDEFGFTYPVSPTPEG